MSATVSAEAFEANPSRYHDQAQEHPVVIVREGKPATILLSVEEYARLLRRDRAGHADEIAHIDALLEMIDAIRDEIFQESQDTVPGARVVDRDTERGMVTVVVEIDAELMREAGDLGIDISRAAADGISAAVTRAKEQGSQDCADSGIARGESGLAS